MTRATRIPSWLERRGFSARLKIRIARDLGRPIGEPGSRMDAPGRSDPGIDPNVIDLGEMRARQPAAVSRAGRHHAAPPLVLRSIRKATTAR